MVMVPPTAATAPPEVEALLVLNTLDATVAELPTPMPPPEPAIDAFVEKMLALTTVSAASIAPESRAATLEANMLAVTRAVPPEWTAPPFDTLYPFSSVMSLRLISPELVRI